MKSAEYKKLTRIYLPVSSLEEGGELSLDEKQSHYLKHVMRKTEGDFLRVFNAQDGEWLAEISEIRKNACKLEVKEKLLEQKASRDVWAVASIIKKDALDLMIEKSCELGASRFFPVICDNTVVHKINQERLQSIAIEAAEQTERLDLMLVEEVSKLARLIDSHKDRRFIVCLERNSPDALIKIVSQNLKEKIAVVIGPEGGFSDDEAEVLSRKENVVFASLGKNILRAETALITALAVVQAVINE